MLCVECPCTFTEKSWKKMLKHYREKHPDVKRPWEYYTREAREKNP